MARCISWRPVPLDGTHPAEHAPGDCRKCWTVCTNRVPRGRARCGECERAIATHPRDTVRAALVRERGTCSADVLELLTGDMVGVIAIAAQARLAMEYPERVAPLLDGLER